MERSWRKVKAKVRKDKGRERSVSTYSSCRTWEILSIFKLSFSYSQEQSTSSSASGKKVSHLLAQTLDFPLPKCQKKVCANTLCSQQCADEQRAAPCFCVPRQGKPSFINGSVDGVTWSSFISLNGFKARFVQWVLQLKILIWILSFS